MKFLVILFAFVCYTLAAVFQHTIMRVESTRERLIRTEKWEEFMRDTNFLKNQTKIDVFDSLSQNIFKGFDLKYSAIITVGTPGQTFLVVLDTGSGMFWIPDINCGKADPICKPICDDKDGCKLVCDPICCQPQRTVFVEGCNGKRKFDYKKSSTYIAYPTSFDYRYATGKVRGFYGKDEFNFIGNNKNLTVTGVFFGQATKLPAAMLRAPFDGILGLGLTTEPGPCDTKLPLIQAIEQNLLDHPAFTVYFKYGAEIGKVGGAVTYGEFDQTNCGQIIAYQKSVSNSYWKYRINGISMGDVEFTGNFEVLSDTGAGVIVTSPGIAKDFAESIGGKLDPKLKSYLVRCDANIPDMIITIGTHTFTIKKKVLVADLGSKDGFCFFRVIGREFSRNVFIFGAPFMESYCHFYNYGNKSIGFALPKIPIT